MRVGMETGSKGLRALEWKGEEGYGGRTIHSKERATYVQAVPR